MSPPLISVIIPTYNRALMLKTAIDSVISQSYTNWELIVIDNESTDNTLELVLSYKHQNIKLVTIRNNGIIARSRNAGINVCLGKYVAFLDSDDWWECQKLENVVNEMCTGDDVYYTNYCRVDSNSYRHRKDSLSLRQVRKDAYVDLLQNGNQLACSTVVIKKEVLQTVNGFCEENQLVTMEDFDCWLRLARAGASFRFLNSCDTNYTTGSHNMSRSPQQIKALTYFRKKYAQDIKSLRYPPLWLIVAQYRSIRSRWWAYITNYIHIKSIF